MASSIVDLFLRLRGQQETAKGFMQAAKSFDELQKQLIETNKSANLLDNKDFAKNAEQAAKIKLQAEEKLAKEIEKIVLTKEEKQILAMERQVAAFPSPIFRSEEHTSELQSR